MTQGCANAGPRLPARERFARWSLSPSCRSAFRQSLPGFDHRHLCELFRLDQYQSMMDARRESAHSPGAQSASPRTISRNRGRIDPGARRRPHHRCVPTTAWSTRAGGFCDFLNRRWLDYAGFTYEEAVGWTWSSVIHPDDANDLFGHWKARLDSGAPVDVEARMRRHDGVYRWFLSFSIPAGPK
jgi:PAS domain S-box-containing protein